MSSQSREEEARRGRGKWLMVCGSAFSFLGHGLVVGGAGFCHCTPAPTSPLFLYSAANTERLYTEGGGVE